MNTAKVIGNKRHMYILFSLSLSMSRAENESKLLIIQLAEDFRYPVLNHQVEIVNTSTISNRNWKNLECRSPDTESTAHSSLDFFPNIFGPTVQYVNDSAVASTTNPPISAIRPAREVVISLILNVPTFGFACFSPGFCVPWFCGCPIQPFSLDCSHRVTYD
jgi:hypothetical protein